MKADKKQKANFVRRLVDLKYSGVTTDRLFIVHSTASALDVIKPVIQSLLSPKLYLWTWTIGVEQSGELANMCRKGVVSSLSVIVDTSFKKRLPSANKQLRSIADVRYASTHCKIYLVRSGRKTVAIISSANLNKNNRHEFYYLTADTEKTKYLMDEFESLYATAKK